MKQNSFGWPTMEIMANNGHMLFFTSARCPCRHGLYRYNMLQSKGHWFPGTFATEDALAKVDASKAPAVMDVVGMLRETHRELYKAPK
jgi:predicted aldo/keto reductase-like oxidoreductase